MNGNGKKICFVAPSAFPVLAGSRSIQEVGGAEVQQSILARELAKRGWCLSMICLDYGQEPDCIIDTIQVLKTYKLSAGIPGLRYFHPRMTSLFMAMKRIDADIYYQRSASMLTGLTALFCKLFSKKMVYAVAADTDLMPGRQIIRYKRDVLCFEWGLKHADAVVTQSQAQKKLCRRNYRRDSVFIRSTHIISDTAIGKEKTTDVLWVGTINKWKRPDMLIALAKMLPKYRFKIIGGPSTSGGRDIYYEKISLLAQRTPNLEFTGFIPYVDIDEHFERARLLVNTSEHEGFPNTFLQAWARSVPTVSFVGPHLFAQNKQSAPNVATLEQMAEHIQKMLDDDVLYRDASHVCREYMLRYHSPAQTIDDYEKKVFNKLLI